MFKLQKMYINRSRGGYIYDILLEFKHINSETLYHIKFSKIIDYSIIFKKYYEAFRIDKFKGTYIKNINPQYREIYILKNQNELFDIDQISISIFTRRDIEDPEIKNKEKKILEILTFIIGLDVDNRIVRINFKMFTKLYTFDTSTRNCFTKEQIFQQLIKNNNCWHIIFKLFDTIPIINSYKINYFSKNYDKIWYFKKFDPKIKEIMYKSDLAFDPLSVLNNFNINNQEKE
jgi:hypothetical protein